MTEEAPKPEYRRFESESDFQGAIDTLFAQEGRELRIFDPDLTALRLNTPKRVTQLEDFLRASRTRRIQIALHDPGHLTRQCPRMMNLLKLFNHAIQIHRTHEEIRSLHDSFLVLDVRHHVRRPLATQYRGAIVLNDENEGLSMRARFLDIWAASFPGVSTTTAGL